MMSFKDEILQTLFGGGIADYEMLEKCNYDFEDILQYIKGFTSVDEMGFNDILLGAIDLFRDNLQSAIEDKKDELVSEIKYLEDRLDYVAYGKKELYEIESKKTEYEQLCDLDTFNDIEYNTNYLDTDIWFTDDEIKTIYKELLSKEIDEENEKIGFVELDLD